MKPLSIGGKVLLALLVLGAGFAAFADTDWSGCGTGDWGGLHPFYIWQGTLVTSSTPNKFEGYWGGDEDNWIRDNTSYDSGTGTYYVGQGLNPPGGWAYDGTERGKWKGWYHPSSPDTCWGTWGIDSDWDDGGTWWGDLAGD